MKRNQKSITLAGLLALLQELIRTACKRKKDELPVFLMMRADEIMQFFQTSDFNSLCFSG